MGGYVTAKAALASFSRCMANEVAGGRRTGDHREQRLTFPGIDRPALPANLWVKMKLSSSRQTSPLRALAVRDPSKRLAQFEDIANAVLFLAAQESSFVTGANIPVTGGEVF